MTSDIAARIIVLGESGVGKTSLLLRFVKGIFKDSTPNTIVDCYHVKIEVEGKMLTLELWDTAGQDRFKAIVKNYFRKADGVLLVYDVTNISSFLKLSSWLAELRQINETATAIIVGNKKDEIDMKTVSLKSVREFAHQENMEFFEASAKKGHNVKHIFEFLTQSILKTRETTDSSTPQENTIPPNPLNPDVEDSLVKNDSKLVENEQPLAITFCDVSPQMTNELIHLDYVGRKRNKKCC